MPAVLEHPIHTPSASVTGGGDTRAGPSPHPQGTEEPREATRRGYHPEEPLRRSESLAGRAQQLKATEPPRTPKKSDPSRPAWEVANRGERRELLTSCNFVSVLYPPRL